MIFTGRSEQTLAEREARQWRKKFAYLPTRVGLKEGRAVWIWWNHYYEIGPTDFEPGQRKLINPPPDVKPYESWMGAI